MGGGNARRHNTGLAQVAVARDGYTNSTVASTTVPAKRNGNAVVVASDRTSYHGGNFALEADVRPQTGHLKKTAVQM